MFGTKKWVVFITSWSYWQSWTVIE